MRGNGLPPSVAQYAAKIGAQLYLIHRDFGFNQETNQWRFWGGRAQRYTLPLPALRGAEQLNNACVCLMTLELLHDRLPVGMQALREGLLKVRLPGRLQVLPMHPVVVLDVAHNPAAAVTLARGLGAMRSFGKTYAIFSMLKDKDIGGVIDALKHHIDVWLIAPVDTARAAGTPLLFNHLREQGITPETSEIHAFEDVIAAYVFACEHADKNDDRICVQSQLK